MPVIVSFMFLSVLRERVRLRAVPALCVAASPQTQPQDAPLEAVRGFRKDQNHEHRHHQGHGQDRGGRGSAALLGSQRSGAPGQGSRRAVTPFALCKFLPWFTIERWCLLRDTPPVSSTSNGFTGKRAWSLPPRLLRARRRTVQIHTCMNSTFVFQYDTADE